VIRVIQLFVFVFVFVFGRIVHRTIRIRPNSLKPLFGTSLKKLKPNKTLNENSSLLWDVTCHMGLHSVTCYLTQVNAPRLNPSH